MNIANRQFAVFTIMWQHVMLAWTLHNFATLSIESAPKRESQPNAVLAASDGKNQGLVHAQESWAKTPTWQSTSESRNDDVASNDTQFFGFKSAYLAWNCSLGSKGTYQVRVV